MSAAGGWDVVPPTVLRDGPAGRGTVQLWIEGLDGSGDEDAVLPRPDGLVDLVPRRAGGAGLAAGVRGASCTPATPVVVVHADRPDLAGVAVLDVVINNADRKGSHLVLDRQGSLWGFDHGLSFHEELKLRTVLWGWAGDAAARRRAVRLDGLAGRPGRTVASSLAQALERCSRRPELVALRARFRPGCCARGRLPAAAADRVARRSRGRRC